MQCGKQRWNWIAAALLAWAGCKSEPAPPDPAPPPPSAHPADDLTHAGDDGLPSDDYSPTDAAPPADGGASTPPLVLPEEPPEVVVPALPALSPELRRRIPDLASQDAAVREAAEAEIAALGDEALPQLLAAMRDESSAVRRGAAYYLLERFDSRDPRMEAVFAAALTDSDRLVRRMAFGAVRQLDPPDAAPFLTHVAAMLDPAREDDPQMRADAARFLSGQPLAAEALAPRLLAAVRGDPAGQVRGAALFALHRLQGDEAALPEITRALRDDPDPDVRRLAAGRLQRLAGPAAEQAPAPLAAALADEDDGVARAAADALIALGPPAVAPLAKALDSPEPRVRRLAVFALGKLGPLAAPALPALRRRLTDEDAETRALAEAVLRALTPEGSEF